MMAQAFVRDLGLPTPDYDLGVGSASHAVQTARVMIEFEKVCLAERPDLVVVVGDVNSTVAASLVAAKLLIPVAHVEAGLRSRDRDDARRNQPHRHRPAVRPAADAVAVTATRTCSPKACRSRRFTSSATS